MMEITPFYLVWCPTRGLPTKKQPSFLVAEAEAKRLARANPGEDFYVTAAVAHVVKIDVGVTRFTIPGAGHGDGCNCCDCIPF